VRGQGRTVVEFLKRYNPVGSGYPEKVAAFGRLIMFDNQIDLFQTIGVNCAVLNCDLQALLRRGHNATGRIHPVGRFGATLPKR
jgi:hypothetical protein